MSSIPLPALHVNTPQQPDPTQNIGRLLQLRAMIQNQPLQRQALQQQVQAGALSNQQQQMQINSAQAMMGAFSGLDPSDPSYFEKGLKNMQTSGKVLPQQIMQMGNAVLDHQVKLQQLPQEQLKTQQALGDSLYSMGQQYLKMPDQQMAEQWPSMRAKIAQLEGVNPQAVTQQLPEQFPGRDAVQQLTTQVGMSAAMMRAAAAQQSSRYKEAGGALYDVSGQAPKPALAGQMDPTQWSQAINNAIPNDPANAALKSRTQSLVNFYLGQGNVAEAQKSIDAAAKQVGEVEQQTNPHALAAKEQVAQAEGAARARAFGEFRDYQVYDNKTGQTVYMTPAELNQAKQTDPGRFTAPSYSAGALGEKAATNYFVSGKGGQQLTAFNTALNHLDLLDKLGSDLNNSDLQIVNKAKQAWAEQTGGAAPANFAAAKNAMSGEVAAALKASGATDQEISAVGSTFNRAQSPAQLKGAIQTYRTLLESKAHNLQQQYEQGIHGKPNFGNAPHTGGNDPFAQFGGKSH